MSVRSMTTPIIRTLAFIRKEAVEVARQPRLLLLLVVGPFVILLLFGAGLRDVDPPIRTMFVAPEDSELTTSVVEFANSQSERLTVEGVTTDEEEALDRLRHGGLEMVVAFPDEVREKVRDDQHAVITLYHTQIDPVEGRAIELFMQTAVDEANRQILNDAVAEAQVETEDLHERVVAARERTSRLRTALDSGSDSAADREVAGLSTEVAAVALAAGPVLAILESSEDSGGEASALQERLGRLDELVEGIGGTDDREAEAADVSEDEVTDLEQELAELDDLLTEFRDLSPEVVVAPFVGEAVRVGGEGIELSDFYAPAVAVVLLQHLLITALGLSLVRETELGTVELYQAAPLRAGEIVIGKYLAHMLIAGIVAAALLAALVFGLGVPMLGDPWWLAAGVAAVVLASAGVGLLVSLASRSDSQAVQYAMLLLLVTVFFSGFLLSLQRFIPEVGWVSWLVPATYGIEVLRDVMLRGTRPELGKLAALAGIGVGLGVVSWLWMRRRLRTG